MAKKNKVYCIKTGDKYTYYRVVSVFADRCNVREVSETTFRAKLHGHGDKANWPLNFDTSANVTEVTAKPRISTQLKNIQVKTQRENKLEAALTFLDKQQFELCLAHAFKDAIGLSSHPSVGEVFQYDVDLNVHVTENLSGWYNEWDREDDPSGKYKFKEIVDEYAQKYDLEINFDYYKRFNS